MINGIRKSGDKCPLIDNLPNITRISCPTIGGRHMSNSVLFPGKWCLAKRERSIRTSESKRLRRMYLPRGAKERLLLQMY